MLKIGLIFCQSNFFLYLYTEKNFNVMTRNEAQQIVLKEVENEIKKYGEDGIALLCPKPGKNSWTWKEYKEAVMNDTDLEGCENSNPIDAFLNLEEWKKKHIIK